MTADERFGAFRLGDVRGIYPDEIDESFVSRFAHAFATHFNLRGPVATGRDVRGSSPALQDALNSGFLESGIDVVDLGLCATELCYYASTTDDIEAAIVVTASHNPPQYNGLKCVLRNGKAIAFDDGLADVMSLMREGHKNARGLGTLSTRELAADYARFVHQQLRFDAPPAGSIALNGLNGSAATIAGEFAREFALPINWFRQEPGPLPPEGADPSQPRLVEQMRHFMSTATYSLGVAWDGDCDRCVFFDSDGVMAPTYYVVGLLAGQALRAHGRGSVVFDTKLCFNTYDVITRLGGTPVPSETGHTFMNRHMRETQAIYGGELSSHHYFSEFFHCDSGMFAWLKMVALLGETDHTLSELIDERRQAICCTPEISIALTDAEDAFEYLRQEYAGAAKAFGTFDGPNFTMDDWRFTLRNSKTEPLIRVNFESRGAPDNLLEHAHAVMGKIARYQSDDTDWISMLRIQ
jgi:phosphomannomutase